MDRNLKETAVRNSNEIHENDGSANTRMRAKCPLWTRIVLACGAVLLLLVAGVAAVNLSASITFNQATASLNANIKAAQDESTDITTLKAQQRNSPRPGEGARFCCRKSRTPSTPMLRFLPS